MPKGTKAGLPNYANQMTQHVDVADACLTSLLGKAVEANIPTQAKPTSPRG